MPTVTCSNCKYALRTDEELRMHYKSDFHRYNIKRTLVGLPPISIELFDSKKAQLEEQHSQKAEEYKCKPCNKVFSSDQTLKQHLSSKKHKDCEREGKEPMRIPSAPKSDTSQMDLISLDSSMHSHAGTRLTSADDESVCLFCNKKSANLNHNIVHMREKHSFFFTDEKSLKDPQGLIKYLGQKIHLGCICLYCDNMGKDFKTGTSVQAHMVDKGHCFMNVAHMPEYAKFYSFGEGSSLKTDDYTYLLSKNEGNEGDWEDDEIAEEEREDEDFENLTKEEREREEFRNTRAQYLRFEREFPKGEFISTGEIRLQNGSIIGHREFRAIYRQFYRELPQQRMQRFGLADSTEKRLALLNKHHAQIMLRGLENLSINKHLRPIAQLKQQTKEQKERLKVGLKANKVNQMHFIQATP